MRPTVISSQDDEPVANDPNRRNRIRVELGKNIHNCRVTHGKSLESVVACIARHPRSEAARAQQPELTVNDLASIEAGTQWPSPRQLWLIARAFEVRVFEDLFAGILVYDPNW